jgi:hypothetical protein
MTKSQIKMQVERSSIGTASAKAARKSVSTSKASMVVARAAAARKAKAKSPN